MELKIINNLEIELFTSLAESAAILTPNRRLAATLHSHYQLFKQKQNEISWQTPEIVPLNRWIERLWFEVGCYQDTPLPLLLKPSQVAYLWEQNIRQSKLNHYLLQLSETADCALSAWKLLKQWQLSLNHPLFNSFEDYRAFRDLATTFEEQCKQHHWIDADSLPDQLCEKLKHAPHCLPTEIILFGFTELSPQIQNLLTLCEEMNKHVVKLQLIKPNTQSFAIEFQKSDTEIETIARFAKQKHEADPNATIGCVFPQLATERDRIKQQFTAVFGEDNLFNLSAGQPLSEYPVIYTALKLLELNKKTISREVFSEILLSPFIRDAERERFSRAKADRELKKENISIVIARSGAKKQSSALKTLDCFFAPLLAITDRLTSHQTFGEWAETFTELLTCMGWPGERSLVSIEYQTIEAWLNLLTDFRTIDYVSKPVTYEAALTYLKKMAKNSIFQPKSPETRIQVLGQLEAAGLPFDTVWIAGLDDVTFPPIAKPNPFIPKKLQRDLHMPHATALRELNFCADLIQQFKESASQSFFSYSVKNEENDCEASSLIRHIPPLSLSELKLADYQTSFDCVYQSRKVETLTDNKGPALALDEKVKGGVSIIKLQALCPFKAFAEKRLHAKGFDEVTPGMRARERGEYIHQVLDSVWQKLKNQATLLAISASELNTLISECMSETLSWNEYSLKQRPHYIQLEQQRIASIIRDWLEIEKQRPDFKIKHTELSTTLQLNHLTLETRIDRIDELPDGSMLIIDYKTGKLNNIYQWLGERLDEPQLPLYLLENSHQTVGIAFAQLATGDQTFKGLSQYTLDIQGIKLPNTDWHSLLNQWQTILTKLAEDFCNGDAQVDPKDKEETCQWCELKPLCRVNGI